MKKDLWFRTKRYGYGWVPVNYKGWLVVVCYIVLNIDAALILLPVYRVTNEFTSAHWLFLSIVFVNTIIMLGICLLKGEKPRWRWGD